MIYITGDTHGKFYRLNVPNIEKNEDTMLIILGDTQINYYLDKRDTKLKEYLSQYQIKMFCIQGNHDARPENICNYTQTKMFGGEVFIEKQFPNLIFAKNGEIYEIEGKRVLVIGGAYSVDKHDLIRNNEPWFKDEQLSSEEKKSILKKIATNHIDIVLSHTCPLKYIPKEALLDNYNEILIDKSMECFLDKVEDVLDYDKWYCGHFHIEKSVDKIQFIYQQVYPFDTQAITHENKTKIKRL